MRRRDYLALAGAGSATLLAGCGSGDGGDSSDGGDGGDGDDNENDDGADPTPTETATETGTPIPASFENPSVDGPETVVVGAEATLTVSVSNTGEATGTYEDTLVVTEGNSEFSAEISIEVAGGETGTTDVEFTPELGDEYTFELSEGGATYSIETEPSTAALGESLSITENIEATLTEVDFRQGVFHEYTVSAGLGSRSDLRVLNAASERTLAVFRLDLENVGTEAATVVQNQFELSAGEFYDSLPEGASLFDAQLSGGPVDGFELEPSQRGEGWILAQLPVSEAAAPFELRVQRDARETPPEAAWEVLPNDGEGGERSFPSFEFVSVDSPDTVSTDEEFDISVQVRNSGEATGTFRGVLQFFSGTASQWAQLRTASESMFTADIQPGETTTFTATNSTDQTGTFRYRLHPFAEEWEITIQ